MVSFATEGADVGAIVFLVGASSAVASFDVEHDADLAIVWCPEFAVHELCPSCFSVREL